ncbi:sirohydrochlorin chelatase [Marinicrinis lubricantis]|uniref:Sirohydrochlorin chelatase n=1 Tax=Marinicrinis lubricantis TaxID=2086470 RepID=A0ABW1IUC7_9BACL
MMEQYGVLVISHGSRDEEWVRLVTDAVEQMELSRSLPVECSFLELVEGRLIQDGIDRLEAAGVTHIIVVPLFVSSGSTHIDEISWALGVKDTPILETDLERFRIQGKVTFCSPLDDDPIAADILYEKIKPLSERPEREIVMLVGHGSNEDGFHQAWLRGMESLAAQVKRLGGFAESDVSMLLPDQLGQKVREWNTRQPDYQVIVAPLFLSEGYFTNRVVPQRLDGCVYRYNGKAMLPHPNIVNWLEKQVHKALGEKTG